MISCYAYTSAFISLAIQNQNDSTRRHPRIVVITSISKTTKRVDQDFADKFNPTHRVHPHDNIYMYAEVSTTVISLCKNLITATRINARSRDNECISSVIQRCLRSYTQRNRHAQCKYSIVPRTIPRVESNASSVSKVSIAFLLSTYELSSLPLPPEEPDQKEPSS